MKNILLKIWTILQSKQATRFYWNAGNTAIGLTILIVTELDILYAPLIISALNLLTKEINNKLTR